MILLKKSDFSKSGFEKQTIKGITGRTIAQEKKVFVATGKTTNINLNVKQGQDLLPVTAGKTTLKEGSVYTLGVKGMGKQAGLYVARPNTGATQFGYYSGKDLALKETQKIDALKFKGISSDYLLGIKGKTLARETIPMATGGNTGAPTLTKTFTTKPKRKKRKTLKFTFRVSWEGL